MNTTIYELFCYLSLIFTRNACARASLHEPRTLIKASRRCNKPPAVGANWENRRQALGRLKLDTQWNISRNRIATGRSFNIAREILCASCTNVKDNVRNYFAAASFYYTELKWFNLSGIVYFMHGVYTAWYVILRNIASFPTRRDKLNVFLNHAQTRVLEDTRMYKNLPVPSIKLNIEL